MSALFGRRPGLDNPDAAKLFKTIELMKISSPVLISSTRFPCWQEFRPGCGDEKYSSSHGDKSYIRPKLKLPRRCSISVFIRVRRYRFSAGTVFVWNAQASVLDPKGYEQSERFWLERFLDADLNKPLKGHWTFWACCAVHGAMPHCSN